MGLFHGSMADIDHTLKLLCLSIYCRNTVAVKAQSQSASDACSRWEQPNHLLYGVGASLGCVRIC